MRGERGQATVEWLALVLLAALILGAAAAGATGRGDREVGAVLAERILGGAAAPDAPAAAEVPALAAAVTPRVRAPAPPPHAPPPLRAADAFQRLRDVGTVAKHTWIFCLGYRSWRYEVEHPRAPTVPVPLEDALEMINSCLNPYAFLMDE
jgi:hypothetical protein